jgi:hypothetical protein
MYKNKLSEWGLSKYLPRGLPNEVTQFIPHKIEERKEQGKEKTEFKYGNRVLPLERIQEESAKRSKDSQTVPVLNGMAI